MATAIAADLLCGRGCGTSPTDVFPICSRIFVITPWNNLLGHSWGSLGVISGFLRAVLQCFHPTILLPACLLRVLFPRCSGCRVFGLCSGCPASSCRVIVYSPLVRRRVLYCCVLWLLIIHMHRLLLVVCCLLVASATGI